MALLGGNLTLAGHNPPPNGMAALASQPAYLGANQTSPAATCQGLPAAPSQQMMPRTRERETPERGRARGGARARRGIKGEWREDAGREIWESKATERGQERTLTQ